MTPVEKRLDHELDHRPGDRRPGRRRGPDDFFGLDVGSMSPKAQVTTGLAGLVPVAVAGVAVLALVPSLWWLIFVFGWMIFPALGLLVRGIAGLSDGPKEFPVSNDKERELLGALREHGELTPARAAMETSLRLRRRISCSRSWPRAGTWRCVCGVEDFFTGSGSRAMRALHKS